MAGIHLPPPSQINIFSPLPLYDKIYFSTEHFNTDPDPAFYFDTDPDPTFHFVTDPYATI
jgi:hypothetical protein